MSHYHPTGWDQRQVLVDGCPECEERAGNPERVISLLDTGAFEAAWKRAVAWQRADSRDLNVSVSEAATLRTLWTVALQLQRRGIPLGEVPSVSAEEMERAARAAGWT